MNPTSTNQDRPPLNDPIFKRSKHEAIIIIAAWLIAVTWTITYCYRASYVQSTDEVDLTWGMPSWVFWGVIIPWLVSAIFAILFSLCYMADADLENIQACDEQEFSKPSFLNSSIEELGDDG